MKSLTISLLSLFSLITFTYSQEVIRKNRSDFNKDGITDYVEISEDRGTSIYTTSLIFRDGKAKSKYRFLDIYNNKNFFSICNIPNNRLGETLLKRLGDSLFYSNQSNIIDPSLSWLIDACSNKQEEESDNSLFYCKTRYTPIWLSEEPQIPRNYHVLLNSKKYERLLRKAESSADFGGSEIKSDFFWINYRTNNHNMWNAKRGEAHNTSPIRLMYTDSSSSQLYATAHGVILKRSNKYSWIFMNDGNLFDGNEGNRWQSIEGALILKDYVLVRQSVSLKTRLYAINPQTGYVLGLNTQLLSVEKMKLNSEGDSVILTDSDGNTNLLTMLMLDQLFSNL